VEENSATREATGKRPIVEAYKESTKPQRLMVLIVLAFFFMTTVTHLISWAIHKPPLRPDAVGFAMLSMLGICIWHSWIVKGKRQTIAFFLIAWAISWFCEFIGHNYAWFFGHYKYTGTLGPRIGGVPILIIVTWSVVIYSAYMLIDWLIGLRGAKQGRAWWGKTLWALLIAASTATLVCAWDMMVDPFATSKVWMTAVDKEPWWWWEGGPYLKELSVWKGKGGVPIGNFVGWWLAPFFIIFIFYLLFQKRNIISEKLISVVPLLVYAFIYYTVVVVVLEMNWFENGMNQVALIGTFTMMPVILVGFIKVAKDYAAKQE
jgi:uncharacterized membrane protein